MVSEHVLVPSLISVEIGKEKKLAKEKYRKSLVLTGEVAPPQGRASSSRSRCAPEWGIWTKNTPLAGQRKDLKKEKEKNPKP